MTQNEKCTTRPYMSYVFIISSINIITPYVSKIYHNNIYSPVTTMAMKSAVAVMIQWRQWQSRRRYRYRTLLA